MAYLGGTAKISGTQIIASGRVDANKAQRQALADRVTSDMANFKADAHGTPSMPQQKGEPKAKNKPKKAGPLEHSNL